LPLGKRVSLLFRSKELSSKINVLKPLLIKTRIKEYEKKFKLYTEKLSKYNKNEIILNYIEKGFIPSKTAQNGLNFLTKEDENNLYKLSNIEQVQNLVKLIYILLNESYENISSETLISNLVNNLFAKYHVDNFSKLTPLTNRKPFPPPLDEGVLLLRRAARTNFFDFEPKSKAAFIPRAGQNQQASLFPLFHREGNLRICQFEVRGRGMRRNFEENEN
jgi:hypothetical protein